MRGQAEIKIYTNSVKIKSPILKKNKPGLFKTKKLQLSKLKKDDPITYSFAMAVNRAIERKKERGLPIARFDETSGRAYLEYSDGRKEYVEA